MRNELTADRLREILNYDPVTGLFTWRAPRGGRAQAGCAAGHQRPNGYVRLVVERRSYYAHRLAFLHMTGFWPSETVDHLNGVPNDNRWVNLRDVSMKTNAQNLHGPHKDNQTGFAGVTYSKRDKSFIAQLCVDGVNKGLGYFKSPEAAHAAYIAAKRQHHKGNTL